MPIRVVDKTSDTGPTVAHKEYAVEAELHRSVVNRSVDVTGHPFFNLARGIEGGKSLRDDKLLERQYKVGRVKSGVFSTFKQYIHTAIGARL